VNNPRPGIPITSGSQVQRAPRAGFKLDETGRQTTPSTTVPTMALWPSKTERLNQEQGSLLKTEIKKKNSYTKSDPEVQKFFKTRVG
jgi:hypothetical protein